MHEWSRGGVLRLTQMRGRPPSCQPMCKLCVNGLEGKISLQFKLEGCPPSHLDLLPCAWVTWEGKVPCTSKSNQRASCLPVCYGVGGDPAAGALHERDPPLPSASPDLQLDQKGPFAIPVSLFLRFRFLQGSRNRTPGGYRQIGIASAICIRLARGSVVVSLRRNATPKPQPWRRHKPRPGRKTARAPLSTAECAPTHPHPQARTAARGLYYAAYLPLNTLTTRPLIRVAEGLEGRDREGSLRGRGGQGRHA